MDRARVRISPSRAEDAGSSGEDTKYFRVNGRYPEFSGRRGAGGRRRLPYTRRNAQRLGSVRLFSSSTACLIAMIAGLLGAGIAPDAGALTRDYYFERLGSDRGLGQNTVNALAQDAHGFVWVATQGGLHRYDGQRYVQYRHDPRDPASLPDSYVTALA